MVAPRFASYYFTMYFVFGYPRLGDAALTWKSLGLSRDNNDPFFAADYHNFIVILPGVPSACLVKYFK